MQHFTRSLIAAVVAVAATAAGPAFAAAGDNWPDKPITVVVPFAAGASTDIGARRLFQHISQTAGWQYVVDNKPGANSIIGAEAAKRGNPEYTVFMGGLTTHAANPNLFKTLSYDPLGDFIPITRMEMIPQVVFGAPKHRLGTIKELVDLIGKNPGALSYGTGSESSRASAEVFLHAIKQKGIRVPFPASTAAMTNLIGGHLDFMFTDLAAAVPLIRSGQLRPLAMMSAKRLDAFPNVPTMAELGYPAAQITSWSAVFAIKGAPAYVVDKLSRQISAYNNLASTREYFAERGGYIEAMTPEQATAFIRGEMARYKEIYAMMGVQPQ